MTEAPAAGGQVGRRRIEPAPRDGLLPASKQQRYLWFLSQSMPDLPVYNVPILLSLQGQLDEPALREAISRLASRHEGLRTRFRSERGTPCQVIDPPRPVRLPVVDLRSLPAANRLSQATRLAEQELRRSFDLHDGPLVRFWLAKLADDDHLLLLNCHHIVSDGWSIGILTRELATLYAGQDAELPKLEVQPADHAIWQQQFGADAERNHLDYWRTRLAGIPTLDLPTDRPAAQQPSRRGAVYERPLAPGLIEQARRLATEESALTVLSVLLAAFYAVLFRYTGETDLAVGSVFSGRTRPELENLAGYLANTLVLRTDLTGDPTGRELVRRCNGTVLGGLRHQDVPFGVVVEELQPERLPGRNPIFDVCFTMLTGDVVGELSFGDVRVTSLPTRQGTSRFDLTVLVTLHAGGGMSIWVEYSTELFDPERIERLVRHFETVLASMTAEPDRRLSRLELLTPEESHQLLDGWNPRPAEPGSADLLHELALASAARFPDRVALRFEGVDVSYANLVEQASRLARLLQSEHRVGPERVVAILLDRGTRMPVAQLAVLCAGGAWLTLDPAQPADQIARLLCDAAPALVITDSSLADALPPEMPRIDLDDPEVARRTAELDRTPPSCAARPDNAACLIYPSGSTGTVKGVLVPHRAVVNFVGAAQSSFSVTPDDRILQFANPSFDGSIFDIYLALAHGATSVGAPQAVLDDVSLLAELMRRERISIADIPPAVLNLLDPESLPDLRALLVKLDAFPAELVNRWRTARRQLHNAYGSPEVTTACVDYPCPEEWLAAPPPIGRPMLNQRAFVLDPSGNLAPVGVPGQLHIAGAGLARGYLGRPALTAERFVPCPFGEPGARMYATGDMAVWRADGQLQLVGRTDRQVRIQGLWVDLGEIERALVAFRGVKQSVVTVDHTSAGDPRLVAYLVLDRNGAAHDAVGVTAEVPSAGVELGALLSHLSENLPSHMIPASFIVLDTLPFTASGKLDHVRLPRPAKLKQQPSQPLASETERVIAGIWQELLQVEAETIDRSDSFFQLGGNSLVVMRLLSRLRMAFGVEVTVAQVFQSPVLCDLACEVDRLTAGQVLDEVEVDAQLAAMSDEEIQRLLAEGVDGLDYGAGPAPAGLSDGGSG